MSLDADPNSQTTMDPVETSSDFDDMLGNINPAEPVDPDAAPEPQGNSETQGEEGNSETGEESIGSLPQSKQNQTFAQMRVKNRQQSLALQTILQKAGLDPSLADDPDKVMRLLEDAEVEEQAKQLSVPPELLQRLNHLERINRETETERTYQSAVIGFQNLQERFKLSQSDLQSFALQLQQQGMNPFEQPMDVVNTFINMNLDWVLERERQAAVQEALTRQNKAYQHGTVPARTQGRPSNETPGEKINTMAAFDKFIYDMSK